MKPVLCKRGTITEIKGRWFKAFIDCTIERIKGSIIVSDYQAFRDKPVNARKNTQELLEVASRYAVDGTTRTEVEVLRQYIPCSHTSALYEDAKGKIVLVARPDGLVVFTDKSYLTAIEFEDDYGGDTTRVYPRITIGDLKSLGLLSEITLSKIQDEKQQLTKLQQRLYADYNLVKLQKMAGTLGLKLVEKEN